MAAPLQTAALIHEDLRVALALVESAIDIDAVSGIGEAEVFQVDERGNGEAVVRLEETDVR